MPTTIPEPTSSPVLPLSLSLEMLIPDLLSRHPEARPVFDRHGLQGCGGRLGPYETIRFFARAHGVDEDRLLVELREAMASPDREAKTEPSVEEPLPITATIYRRYFLAAIAVALTAGASWGAWLLWSIGLRGTFEAAGIHQVNAHGEAQVLGWVGLFIMGFAYQAFPRFWRTELVAPRGAGWAFVLMVVGLLIRTVGMAATGAWSLALPLAMVGGVLQVVAVTTFAVQIAWTFRKSEAQFDPMTGFILAALGWFVIATVYGVWHTWMTMTATSAEQLAWYVSTYQSPLRDLQIHGLALFMILGVSLRRMPALFDLPKVPERRAWWALGLLSVAVCSEVGLFIAFRWTDQAVFARALYLPWTLLMVGSLMLVKAWRPWRAFPETDRSEKFVRASFAWLLVALSMLLFLPFYIQLAGVTFSHAYYGAIRHAITVGFVSMMILGISSKAVPTLVGVDPRRLSALWGPFLLVNLGCFLRVSLQTLTDWRSLAYPLIGLSGTLEVAGLAWWGIGLARLMLVGEAIREEPVGTESLPEFRGTIEAGDNVGEVLDRFPELLGLFLAHGFAPLRNPLMRKTFARRVSIAQATKMQDISTDRLLEDLNDAIRETCPED